MANEYDSWTGAGEIKDSKLFTTKLSPEDKPNELDQDQTDPRYVEIWDYMPRRHNVSMGKYFIGRVATKSRDTGKDIVKLFPSWAWSRSLLVQLDNAEFTKVGSNLNQLVSNVNIRLDAGRWEVNAPMEVFRDLNPPGIPTAKIVFVNKDDGESVSAFWCWP